MQDTWKAVAPVVRIHDRERIQMDIDQGKKYTGKGLGRGGLQYRAPSQFPTPHGVVLADPRHDGHMTTLRSVATPSLGV